MRPTHQEKEIRRPRNPYNPLVPEVIFLQRSPARRAPMVPAPALELTAGLGIEGDHHAKPGGSRQVLLMAEENSDAFGLAPGEVRENIVTRGLDLQALPPGTRLEIGSAALEITKDCEPCAFIDSLRPGLRPRMIGRRGMLARVLRTGEIQVGDPVGVLRPRA
jgi:MOSC domain-containing protein YiiM